LLGVLIARASGQSFETFLRQRVFEPLGMIDTTFSVPAADLGRLATGYSTDPESGALALYDEPAGQWSSPPAFPSGGAGLVSTAADFLAFAEMLLRGGGPLLSRPSVETMTTDQLTAAQKAISGFFPGDFDARGWGFGVGLVTRREQTWAPVGQYGWDGGARHDLAERPVRAHDHPAPDQCRWTSPKPPPMALDFLTGAYAAIDDGG